MIKGLFDTNSILDIALKRDIFFDDALSLFALIDVGKITAFVTASTITDIYYISKREIGHEQALSFIKNLIEFVDIIGVDKKNIINALYCKMTDFEDAIQTSAAQQNDIEFILTRNKKDFTTTAIKTATPREFLNNITQ